MPTRSLISVQGPFAVAHGRPGRFAPVTLDAPSRVVANNPALSAEQHPTCARRPTAGGSSHCPALKRFSVSDEPGRGAPQSAQPQPDCETTPPRSGVTSCRAAIAHLAQPPSGGSAAHSTGFSVDAMPCSPAHSEAPPMPQGRDWLVSASGGSSNSCKSPQPLSFRFTDAGEAVRPCSRPPTTPWCVTPRRSRKPLTGRWRSWPAGGDPCAGDRGGHDREADHHRLRAAWDPGALRLAVPSTPPSPPTGSCRAWRHTRRAAAGRVSGRPRIRSTIRSSPWSSPGCRTRWRRLAATCTRSSSTLPDAHHHQAAVEIHQVVRPRRVVPRRQRRGLRSHPPLTSARRDRPDATDDQLSSVRGGHGFHLDTGAQRPHREAPVGVGMPMPSGERVKPSPV